MLRLVKWVWTNRFPIVDQAGNPVGYLLWETTARVNGEPQTYEGWSLYYYKPNDCERFVGRYATRRRALNVLEDLETERQAIRSELENRRIAREGRVPANA